jgi:hypothetical protein
VTSITSLLCPPNTDATDHLRGALNTADLAGKMTAALTGVADPVSAVARALTNLLDTQLGELVDLAWADQNDVRAAIIETRGKSSAWKVIRLVHERLVITDAIRIDFCGVEIPRVEPTLRVTLDVEAVVVTVRAGRISEVSTAQATVIAELLVENKPVLTGPLTPVALFGTLVMPSAAASVMPADPTTSALAHAGQ